LNHRSTGLDCSQGKKNQPPLNRHPESRKASKRTLKLASRLEGPFAFK
jgi:hypothetical protein